MIFLKNPFNVDRLLQPLSRWRRCNRPRPRCC